MSELSMRTSLIGEERPSTEPRSLKNRVDRYFEITTRGSTFATEIRAGCISWMTMSYIMVVNPMVLAHAPVDKGDALSLEALMTATAVSAAVGSLAVGVLGKAPFAMMPGMGLNAYFVFGICHHFKVSFGQALSCSFMAGAVLLMLALLGICARIVKTVLTDHLKCAITVAIGLFQALIGFQVVGLIEASPDTLLQLGDLSFQNTGLWLGVFGFLLISVLMVCKVHGALLLGIWVMAAVGWLLGLQPPPQGLLSLPRLDYLFVVDFTAWAAPGSAPFAGMLVGTTVLLFVALFDLAGVQYGLASLAGLLDRGEVPRSSGIFASAALSTMAGAALGTSPVIIATECSSGIAEGARTGFASVVTALLFALSAAVAPVLVAVPRPATAVPLVLIGALMMAPCAAIDWSNLRLAIPSFLTITVVPFTYSIHNGIAAGVLVDGLLWSICRAFRTTAGASTQASSVSPTSLCSEESFESLCGKHAKEMLALLDGSGSARPNADGSDLAREDFLRKSLITYLSGAVEVTSSGSSTRSGDSTPRPLDV